MKNEFEGYELDCSIYELSDKDIEFLSACVFLCDNKYSIRKTSRECCIARSSLCDFINFRLRSMSWELYNCCRKVINKCKN